MLSYNLRSKSQTVATEPEPPVHDYNWAQHYLIMEESARHSKRMKNETEMRNNLVLGLFILFAVLLIAGMLTS